MKGRGQAEENVPNSCKLPLSPFFPFGSSLTPYRKKEDFLAHFGDNEDDKNYNEQRNIEQIWKHQYCLHSNEEHYIDDGNGIVLATTIQSRDRNKNGNSCDLNYETSFVGHISLERNPTCSFPLPFQVEDGFSIEALHYLPCEKFSRKSVGNLSKKGTSSNLKEAPKGIILTIERYTKSNTFDPPNDENRQERNKHQETQKILDSMTYRNKNDVRLCLYETWTDKLNEKFPAETPQVADIDVFLINEGQFFPDLVDWAKKMVSGPYYKMIFVFGLDGDFQRKPFGNWLDLFLKVCAQLPFQLFLSLI